MTMESIRKNNSVIVSELYGGERDAEIERLADAPTGASMESRHWAFLFTSGVVLPVLILLWGWT